MKKQLTEILPSTWKVLSTFLFFMTITIVSFMLCKVVFAESLTLAWDANTENDLAGYNIYYNTASSDGPFTGSGIDQGTSPINVPIEMLNTPDSPAFQLSGLSNGTTYFFTITAYSTSDVESDFSNIVIYDVPKPQPVFHSISTSASGPGSISPSGTIEAEEGQSLTFSISPEPNHHIKDVLVNGKSVGPVTSYTIDNIIATHNIKAVFSIDCYTITASSNENGTISPNGSIEVAHGSSHTYVITPGTGYQISDVKVDGVSIGCVTSHLFQNVDMPHAIEAFFSEIQQEFRMEAGEVTINHNWQQVTFSQEFVNPVVVASALSYNGSNPSVVRIDNVTSTGFELSIQEWDYLDGWHADEVVGYVVMEAGSHILPDGSMIQAGTFDTNSIGSYEKIAFAQPFNQVPVIISAINSFNDPDTVASRVTNVTTEAFEYQMQEQQANSNVHNIETVSYIAWESSKGKIDGVIYEIGCSENAVTHDFKTISFNQSFEKAPVFIAAIQTADGPDPSTVRWDNLTSQSVNVKIEEEQSKDSEQIHTTEVVGYMAFASESLTQDIDTDGDGILDANERLIYQTNPHTDDTDGDGLLDGEELEYWIDNWNSDFDGDGLINLLDADSDDDGTLDGEEVANNSDPADPMSNLWKNKIAFGKVTLNHNWQQVTFKQKFFNPVVVASALSFNGSHPSVVRIDNVTSTGFELSIQEWDYLDGRHTDEVVGYVVMEAGSHILPDGSMIQAGTFDTNSIGSYEKIAFAQPFNQVPVIISAINSFNDPDTVASRVTNVTTEAFEYQMQEQQANSNVHNIETVSYIAWESSKGKIDGVIYEIGCSENAVTHDFKTISFNQSFEKAPVFIAAIQTADGPDPSTVRWDNLTSQSVNVKIEEEQSKDSEQIHTTEAVGYMAFAHE